MFWILIALAVSAFAYWKISHAQNYWRRKGVTQNDVVFFFGDTWPMILKKYSAPEMTENFYQAYPKTRYLLS